MRFIFTRAIPVKQGADQIYSNKIVLGGIKRIFIIRSSREIRSFSRNAGDHPYQMLPGSTALQNSKPVYLYPLEAFQVVNSNNDITGIY